LIARAFFNISVTSEYTSVYHVSIRNTKQTGEIMNLTIRNIPDEIISKLRTLSKLERRSLNNELLIVLENGLNRKVANLFKSKPVITKELQINIWNGLAEKWDDDRSTEEIVKDIYENRTIGREVNL